MLWTLQPKCVFFFVCHRYFKMCTADMTGFFVCFFNPRVSHKMFKKLQVFVSDRSLIQYATDTAVKQCLGSRMCLALRAADIIKQYLLSHIYFTKYSTDIIIRERFDFHNACDRYYNKRPFCVSKFFFHNVCYGCNQRMLCVLQYVRVTATA